STTNSPSHASPSEKTSSPGPYSRATARSARNCSSAGERSAKIATRFRISNGFVVLRLGMQDIVIAALLTPMVFASVIPIRRAEQCSEHDRIGEFSPSQAMNVQWSRTPREQQESSEYDGGESHCRKSRHQPEVPCGSHHCAQK